MKNSKSISLKLNSFEIDLVGGGTENHLCLLDLRKKKIDGRSLE
jgi:glycine/serine hydroxymethyltransferase